MKKTTNKDKFELVNLPKECQDPSISKDDFKLVQVDAKIHDQKFETKPTTFFKDCVRRFRKNKSSVVAAFILGFLVLMSIVVPIAFKTSEVHDTSTSHPELYYLEPKLFDAGTGFWDGTKKMENIVVDPHTKRPDPDTFHPNAISDFHLGGLQYSNSPSEFADGGYVQLGYYQTIPNSSSVPYVSYTTDLVVAEMIQEDPIDPYPDDRNAKENIKSIETVYAPEKLEQKSRVNIDLFSAEIKYDLNDGEGERTKRVSVDSVELSTSVIAPGVTGTVTVGTLTANFTIDIVEKEQKKLTFDQPLSITNFVTLDQNALKNSGERTKTYPKGYTDGQCAIYLVFEQSLVRHEVEVVPYKKVHKIGVSEPAVNVTEKFKEYCDNHLPSALSYEVTDIQLEMRIKNTNNKKNTCTLVKSIGIESDSLNINEKNKFNSYSFENANKLGVRDYEHGGVWIINGEKSANYTKVDYYLITAQVCSFVYDTYEAVLGRINYRMSIQDLYNLGEDVIQFDVRTKKIDGVYVVDPDTFFCRIVNKEKCPLVKEFKITDVLIDPDRHIADAVMCEVYRYKMDPYYLTSMPRFLMGTDKTGRDMFIYVFEGLRTSLLLGIATSAICFLFGLLWGSIAGYFGGNVDLIMERFTDILSGVPWIVVMTLTIIHLGSTFFTFALALCLTGWIGTAAITRTQFYRFRGREYVLASRTLGASHARLIAKHILPNAMGTIITSAVLMVPSIIFSEATISYLGLGFKNLASLGVILSDNQVELTNHPYLLIFPAVIIALLMISFNLFGNGLRDAVNPSLKGEGE